MGFDADFSEALREPGKVSCFLILFLSWPGSLPSLVNLGFRLARKLCTGAGSCERAQEEGLLGGGCVLLISMLRITRSRLSSASGRRSPIVKGVDEQTKVLKKELYRIVVKLPMEQGSC